MSASEYIKMYGLYHSIIPLNIRGYEGWILFRFSMNGTVASCVLPAQFSIETCAQYFPSNKSDLRSSKYKKQFSYGRFEDEPDTQMNKDMKFSTFKYYTEGPIFSFGNEGGVKRSGEISLFEGPNFSGIPLDHSNL